jgi:hypothetical protein
MVELLACPTTDLQAFHPPAPEQLLVLIIDHTSVLAERALLQALNASLVEIGLCRKAVVQRHKLLVQNTPELGLGEDRFATRRIHAYNLDGLRAELGFCVRFDAGCTEEMRLIALSHYGLSKDTLCQHLDADARVDKNGLRKGMSRSSIHTRCRPQLRRNLHRHLLLRLQGSLLTISASVFLQDLTHAEPPKPSLHRKPRPHAPCPCSHWVLAAFSCVCTVSPGPALVDVV